MPVWKQCSLSPRKTSHGPPNTWSGRTPRSIDGSPESAHSYRYLQIPQRLQTPPRLLIHLIRLRLEPIAAAGLFETDQRLQPAGPHGDVSEAVGAFRAVGGEVVELRGFGHLAGQGVDELPTGLDDADPSASFTAQVREDGAPGEGFRVLA